MGVKQRSKSLHSRSDKLATGFYQLNVLNGKELVDDKFESFSSKIHQLGHKELRPNSVEIFQINIGKLCNQNLCPLSC